MRFYLSINSRATAYPHDRWERIIYVDEVEGMINLWKISLKQRKGLESGGLILPSQVVPLLVKRIL